MDKESFQKKEIAILRKAVDAAELQIHKKLLNSEIIGNIINIVEEFIRKRQVICYGGTAINNILPKDDQFYNYDIEMPDYDFFSDNALNDAKNLADIYFKKGYEDVEAKTGIHEGTFKVFVNYIPVADITQLNKTIFNAIKKDSIKINDILYAPPNYLRMSMYLELSRPAGDVSRWEKILKRLILLNKHYPIKGIKCKSQTIQRKFEGKKNISKKAYDIVRESFINQGLVFFGGYANSLYSKYMPSKAKKIIKEIPDFDVLSENPAYSAQITKERLIDANINNVKIYKTAGIGEIIAPHYEINIDGDTIAFIYEPLACHSYNIIKINNKNLKIASIDTMLSFYLAFLYANRIYYDSNRILCMAEFLFNVQAHNRLKQEGLLKRFSTQCYGTQKTLTTIRAEKTAKFKKLKAKKKTKKNKKEFEFNFLRYIPTNKTKKTKNK